MAYEMPALERDMDSSAPVAGPDFVCIGMEKAGTGWLFDQLNAHPDFWMPPVKGLNYLHRRVPRMQTSRRRLLRPSRRDGEVRAKGRTGTDRDRQFLIEASACGQQPRDLARYAALFRNKGTQLSGEITPTYVDMNAKDIALFAEMLPRTKVVLLIRDPISRAASRISMAYRKDRFDEALVHDAAAFREFVETSPLLVDERSSPTQVVTRWKTHAPNVAFRFFFFDDIESRAEQARREILEFFGADPAKGRLAADHNKKANAAKIVFPDSAKAILVDVFKDEVLACARELGGCATAWPARYGLSLDAAPSSMG